MTIMDFNPDQFKQEFIQLTKDLALSAPSENEMPIKDLISAVLETLEIMQRVDVDISSGQNAAIKSEDITEIGGYMLSLLSSLGDTAAHRSMQQTMLQLHRLSLPVAIWISQRGGHLKQIDIVVNAIATLANDIQDTEKLAEFALAIEKIIACVDDELRQDLEAGNQMRPWLVLNINWGIVATRSHNVEIMRRAFDKIIQHVPADAKQFFQEGMQQMEMIDYPDHVRAVMQEYHDMLAGVIRLS